MLRLSHKICSKSKASFVRFLTTSVSSNTENKYLSEIPLYHELHLTSLLKLSMDILRHDPSSLPKLRDLTWLTRAALKDGRIHTKKATTLLLLESEIQKRWNYIEQDNKYYEALDDIEVPNSVADDWDWLQDVLRCWGFSAKAIYVDKVRLEDVLSISLKPDPPAVFKS